VALDAAHAEPGLLAKIAAADATTTAPAAVPVAASAVAPATAAAPASAAACVTVSAAATTTGGTFVALASTVKSCSDNEWRGNGDVAAEMGDIRSEIGRMFTLSVTSPSVSLKVQSVANRYEEVVGALLVRVGVLEDPLKRQTPVPSAVSYAATAARGAHLVASPAAPGAPISP